MSPTDHVTAPTFAPGTKIKGPASYFASIETTYGRPMQDWLDLVTAQWTTGSSHMEIVTNLKNEHDMGHGHANAVVAYVKAALATSSDVGPEAHGSR